MSEIEKAMAKRWGREPLQRVPSQANVVPHPAIAAEKTKVAKPVRETRSSKPRNANSRVLKLTPARLKAIGAGGPEDVIRRMSEEYRVIKRPLLDNAFGKGAAAIENGNLIMLTSSAEGEGKTFTSLNLAISIAQELDRTVLLVDADVARRGISRTWDFKPGEGLTDVLANDELDLGDVLIKTTHPKLTLLSAGQNMANVNELLASEKMKLLTDEIAARYSDRVIIFDSPPLLPTSEARVLAQHMGQILVVVEAQRTSRAMVEEAVSYLDSEKTIGLVLNKKRQSGRKNYYGYGYGSTE